MNDPIEANGTNQKVWTIDQAIRLCADIEAICPPFGAHVALTGGCLYKSGNRKDCDILFYRIRQVEKIDMDGLFAALQSVGFDVIGGFGWCFKAAYAGKAIDMFFPEEQGGEYISAEESDAATARLEKL